MSDLDRESKAGIAIFTIGAASELGGIVLNFADNVRINGQELIHTPNEALYALEYGGFAGFVLGVALFFDAHRRHITSE